MGLSLNAFIQFVIISTFVFIIGWNLLSIKEGLDEDEDEDVQEIDEENEIIDSKTGKKRKMTKREKRTAEKIRVKEEKAMNKDIDERVNSYKG